MAETTWPGGAFTMGDLRVPRIGFGTMRLPGPEVWGPPQDHDEAIAVLRTAYELGVRHFDTAEYYGPHVSNELLREAFHPYPDDLVIVTKVGGSRDEHKGWPAAREPDQLRDQVHANLRSLGLDVLDVVNLRMGGAALPQAGSLAPQAEALAELQQQGLIRHLGVSAVNSDQVAEAQSIATVVCVQNLYNLATRDDDPLIDELAGQGIAYVPFFPVGGFSPLQSEALDAVAQRLGSSALQVAQAWLLQRSPNVLLIPGTSSVAHLRENVAVADLRLPAEAVAQLDAIAG